MKCNTAIIQAVIDFLLENSNVSDILKWRWYLLYYFWLQKLTQRQTQKAYKQANNFLQPTNPANTSTLKQRWSSTFIGVVSTLIFGWKWKLSRRTFFDVVSTLRKQRWLNYVDSSSITKRCFNVDIWLKMKVEPTYVYRRCFNVEKTTLKR